jgi:hypothetical protein
MKKAIISTVATSAVLCLGAQAAIVNNQLSGNKEYDGWDNLKATAPGLTTTILSTAPGFGSNEVGSGDALLLRTSGGHYPASQGLYSFSSNTSFRVSDSVTTFSDIQTVAFTIVSWSNGNEGLPAGSFSTLPTLSFNGGTQALAASYFGTASGGTVDFGGPIQTYAFTFQWDLSSSGDSVTSYDIAWDQIVHTGVLALQLESSDTFTMSNAVPEPSSALLAASAAALVFRRRRR